MELATFPDDGQASYRVFHKLYRVKAPRSLTMSLAEIEMYGQRISGIKQLDKYLSNEMVVGRVPTTEMARIISEGGRIQFCNMYESEDCYKDLHQHLVNWDYILKDSYNVDAPPLEDFEILKELLDALESYAGIFNITNKQANPIGTYSSLSGRDYRRKQSQTRRIPLGGLKPKADKEVEINYIESWEDLEKVNRSMR